MRRIDRNLVLLSALAALLAGCGSRPTARPSGALPAAEPGGGWRGRADVQEAIALLRTKEFDMPLQFNNFRD